MYATMVSFYLPLSVMLVVYGKILGVVADKKKHMSWATAPASMKPRNNSGVSVADQTSSRPYHQGKSGVPDYFQLVTSYLSTSSIVI